MAARTDQFIAELTESRRIIILGGLAVIAHGLSRTTDDADIWLEPSTGCEEWSEFLEAVCKKFTGLTIHRLPGWTEVSGAGLVEAIDETGMVRIRGLECPLDIFRRPNEFKVKDFNAVFERATLREDRTALPHPVDLIISKSRTGRKKDFGDLEHLQELTREEYRQKLPTASLEEATFLLGRYTEWQVLESALENPSPEVKELAMGYLREFAEEGDPFSQAILSGRKLPPPY